MTELYVSELVLVPSLRCTRECDHCCRSSSPKRRATMRWETACAARGMMEVVAADFGVPNVVLSGGEPTLYGRNTWKAVHHVLAPFAECKYGAEALWLITNGDPLADELRAIYVASELRRVCSVLRPAMLVVELSADEYHLWQPDGYRPPLESSFRFFVLELTAQVGWDCAVESGVRNWRLWPHNVIPRGRGAAVSTMQSVECEALCPEDRAVLTIMPDGSIAACPNGGPAIGHVSENLYVVLDRLAALRDELAGRYGLEGETMITTQACRGGCDRIAAALRRKIK